MAQGAALTVLATSQLDRNDAQQEGQADCVGRQDDDVSFHKPINDPKRQARREERQHLE